MEVKPGYKQTEVGVIPEEWECPRIRDAAAKSSNATVGGPFGSDLVSADYVESGVPVIRGQNMSFSFVTGDFAFVSEKKARLLSANLAHPKDLVFTQRGTLGQVAIVPDGPFESYLISQSQMKVSLDCSKYDPLFLLQYFTSAPGQKQIIASAIQTGVPHTNLGILRAYRFPAPPPPEQRAIAEALSDVDGLLGRLDRLIAKKRDLKQAAMQQLLTGQTRLPGFHGEWRTVTFGDVITHCFSGATPRRNRPDYFKGDIRWITSGELNYNVITDTVEKITGEAVARTNLSIIPKGTFLMAITGLEAEKTRGSCGIVGAPSTTNQSCMAVFPTPELVTEYLFYYYVLRGKPLALQYCQGTKQQSYTAKLVKKLPIDLPPTTAEQTAIAEVLTEMDLELAALEQRREKTRTLKQAMMQELLTGRTRLI